jgi:hypothetical protein
MVFENKIEVLTKLTNCPDKEQNILRVRILKNIHNVFGGFSKQK